MVFPSLQLALALSCVMGLVMFARYCGEDLSHKLASSRRDPVSICGLGSNCGFKRSKPLCWKGWTVVVNLMELKCSMYLWFSTDGDILCHGYASRAPWTTWTVYRMFVQCSSQVHEFLLRFFCVCKTYFLFHFQSQRKGKKAPLWVIVLYSLGCSLQHHLLCI